MKTFRNIMLFLIGLSLIVFAGFAYQLGLDSSPGIGKRRALVIAAGVLVMLFPVYSGKIENLAWSFYQKYAALREKVYDRLHVPGELRNGFTRTARKRLAYGSAVLACGAAITAQTWFASAGTWDTWLTFSFYYDQLADAFLLGQTSLERQVNPLLLALPNPYDPEARTGLGYLWDASLYEGKYYLYWGPMPAVILAVVKLIHPIAVGDNLIVFAGVALTTIFQTLLLALLWTRYFQNLPVWSLFLGALVAGLVVPFNLMNNRPEVYEAAIISGQAFLMGGVYFALLAVQPRSVSSRLLAVASAFWACAVASRSVLVVGVIFAALLIFILILRRPDSWVVRYKQIAALGLPLALCALSLGTYNFVRFGSPLEFGNRYQLALFDQVEHIDDFFSTRYILPNIEVYTITPPERVSVFPYMRMRTGDEIEVSMGSPDFYYKEVVTGLAYTFPFAVFAFLPFLWAITKRVMPGRTDFTESGRMLEWTCVLLGGMALIGIAFFLTFFAATMRFLADITPLLSLLAVMGFWFGYRAVSSDWVLRYAYSGIGVLLAGAGMVVSNLIALLVSQRIHTHSPQILPAVDIFFKTLFSG